MSTHPGTLRPLIPGLIFITAAAGLATWIASLKPLQALRFSPLVIGILLGAVLGNTLRARLPSSWDPAVGFSAKKLLRLAIILYGFRITFQEIAAVGMAGLAVDAVMLTSTLIIGIVVGTRVLGLDRQTAILTAAGSAICGAAAVVATEPVVKAEAHQTAVAIATVVLFGTTGMFLYPALFRSGWLDMGADVFGIYIGATVHEVAHVVAAGNASSPVVADAAIIVKMTRVMMLAPALLVLSYVMQRTAPAEARGTITIPWFALGFVAVAGLNSLAIVPEGMVAGITVFDTFLLTMAMFSLGLDTNLSRFKGVGMTPIYLATILFAWLLGGGYVLTRLIAG